MLTPPTPPSRRPAIPLCLLGLFGMHIAHAADTAIEDHRYRVMPGDTLIGIGRTLLADPREWRTVQHLNRVAEPRRLRPGSELRIPLDLLRREGVVARLGAIQGDVRVGDAVASSGVTIDPGTRVTTGERSFATVELADGSRLILQPDSRLRVEELARYRNTDAVATRLRLERGRVESVVEPKPTVRPRYSVVTPAATIGVRGTRFRVGLDEQGAASRAEVTGGTVAVGDGSDATALAAGFGMIAQTSGKRSGPIALLHAPDLAAVPPLHERPVVRFAFPGVEGARQYRVQIGADTAMRRVLTEALVTVPEAKFGDLPDGDYTVRVRGIDANGLEGRDTDASFRLKARPEPPFALAPVRGAKLRAESAELSWSANPEASHYQVQLADASGFDRPLVDLARVDGTTVIPARKLPPGEYRWRSRSVRGGDDHGPWGDAQPFVMKAPPADPAPAGIGERELSFAWSGEPSQTFLFQLARDAGFTDMVAEKRLDQPATTVPRPDAGRYHMRVRATDADGFVGPFTRPQVIDVPPWPVPWWLLILALPVLI